MKWLRSDSRKRFAGLEHVTRRNQELWSAADCTRCGQPAPRLSRTLPRSLRHPPGTLCLPSHRKHLQESGHWLHGPGGHSVVCNPSSLSEAISHCEVDGASVNSRLTSAPYIILLIAMPNLRINPSFNYTLQGCYF